MLAFAVLGFVMVPLGKKTGLEHAQAIFGTPAAAQALRELRDALTSAGAELLGEPSSSKPDPTRSRRASTARRPAPLQSNTSGDPRASARLTDVRSSWDAVYGVCLE